MTGTQPSGVDLARAALAAARAAAKTRPAGPQKKKPTGRRETRRGGRDPMGLGAAITGMMTDRGWEPPEMGGSILDKWPTIAPDLADKVAAVRFEHDAGILHLRPASSAYATQLRLYQAQVLARVQADPSGRGVRGLKILPFGIAPAPAARPLEDPAPQHEEQAPARTRETASIGFQTTRQALLTGRGERPGHTDPDIAAACERQNRVLKNPANREPEAAFAEAVAAADRASGPMRRPSDASRRAALARKRADTAGTA